MGLKNRLPDETTRKKLRSIMLILSVLLGCGLLCFVSYKVVEVPRYIVLSVSPVIDKLVNIYWYFTEYTIEEYEESGYSERHFVWQKRGYRSGDFGSDTWTFAIEYFDKWLAQEGWKQYKYLEYFDPCRNLPESNFLPKGKDGYVAYRQPNTVMYREERTICLAIWPNDSYMPGYYEIVLTTINPSFITGWNSAVEFLVVPPDE